MFYAVFALLLSAYSFAKPLQVHSISDIFVKFSSGEVGFWQDHRQSSLKRFSLNEGQLVDVELSSTHEILKVRRLPQPLGPDHFSSTFIEANEPTILPSYKATQKILDGFNRGYIDGSQCYDRAHIWSYEAWEKDHILFQKMFLFFADHYIEKYRFGWWFHVAPIAKLTMKGELTERVMDPRFSKYPLKVELWTNIFMKNKAPCKEVPLYTDYSEHPLEEDCYLIKSSTYFWQPRDLEEFARSGYEKTEFVDWEVRHAYEHAFNKKL